ncbi:M13 family metallopeptidase [Pseudidiomarina andamanensis]|uniref:M13 family peptidase n=1 Tax=Pseudidiomarina andamanensis TaxID=1940690 RepID=A0AA92EVM0_9GAMM|nr:M13 family metallopeptidase [Pseudidiomarina andamanensis]MDS0217629.1 M13 family metallopeptidase [Pseudidiomarina andamanensis]QGT96621.1 M13 family peptidase [Pseudidiomarina andamanensis]
MNKVSTIALSVALALGVAACSPQQSTEQQNQQAKQEQPQQQLTSGLRLDAFNTDVRPQDDLFQFVNGTWYDNTEMPADKSRIGSFLELRERNQERLRSLIETAAAKDAEAGSNAQKIGDFFNSYMDVEKLNSLGYTPIAADLQAIAQVETHADVVERFAELAKIGVSGPFGFYVYGDKKNPDYNALYMGQSGLSLPDRDYYLKDEEKFVEIRNAYKAYIKDVLALVDYEQAEAAADAILELETKIAEAHWSRVQSRDAEATYNPKTTEEMVALMGSFDFPTYAKITGIDVADKYVVSQLSYFETFGDMFDDVSVETWKHYMTLRTVNRFASVLTEEINDRNFAFYGKVLRGTPEQEPRWKRGVDATDNALGEVLGQLYVEKYFPPAAKARMEELVDNLIVAYGESIKDLEWMSEETKQKALEKLSKFTPYVGYPSEWRDYSELTVTDDNLVENIKRSYAFDYQESISEIGQPVKEEDWGMTPQTVNAYYSPVRNEIVFPAGILQPPFFDMDAEDAVNYGGIGAVIGHELGHGFDDQGSKYDGDGNLNSWWTDGDREAFDARGAQLAAQYDGYEVIPETFINGKLTLGENIGDLAGLTIAYRAYVNSLNGKESPVMDGFTGEQRVFLGWAQVWKNKARDEFVRNQVLSDPHSPADYRVNGTVVNIPAFYEAFDVKPGDDLYLPPEERVTIW